MSSSDWATYPESLCAVVDRLRGVVIEQKPALQVLKYHDGPEALHFVDPPYVQSTRTSRHRYRHEMSEQDHRDLASVLHTMDGAVVLSGYPCQLYDEELYQGWHRVDRPAFAFKARPKTEVIWLNERAWRGGGRLL